jgi:type I restriction enzyme M protein
MQVHKNNLIDHYYLFYLLNSNIVQKQIKMKTFVQATLSTLGNRFLELVLPIHNDSSIRIEISSTIKEIINEKMEIRKRSIEVVRNSI